MAATAIQLLDVNRPKSQSLILLVGPPYCGKSVACEGVTKHFGDKVESLSMGQLLRDCKDEAVQATLREGKFVNAELKRQILRDRISRSSSSCIILDNYIEEGLGDQCTAVFHFTCAKEVLRERFQQRLDRGTRSDDTPENFEKRIERYQGTLPIVEKYEGLGKVTTLNVEANPEEVGKIFIQELLSKIPQLSSC
jgi:adenylate kinase family enzyme